MSEQKKYIDNTQLQGMDVADLLAVNMQDVELVAEYAPKPSGVYRFEVITADVGEVGKEDKPAIQVKLKFTEIAELDDESKVEEVGALPFESTENFLLQAKNGFGVRQFVTFASGLVPEDSDGVQLGELMAALPGATGEVYLALESYTRDLPNGTTEEKVTNRMKATTVQWD